MSTTRAARTATLATLAALLMAFLIWTPPAMAAARDGRCDSGEFCYYYYTKGGGSLSDFTGSLANYGASTPTCYIFKGTGSGQGQCIKNNAASAWNRSGSTVRVYYNSSYAGTWQDIPAGAFVDLNAPLKNDNASHEFRVGGPSRVYLTRQLGPGDSITSPNGRYRLVVNPKDGDMEVRALASALPTGDRIMWSSVLGCSSCSNRLVMQADGNLVLYQGTTARWWSGTDKHPGAQLVLQNDGNVVIYDYGKPIWDTRTMRYQNYDTAVTFIRDEMKMNAAFLKGLPVLERKAVFARLVPKNQAWDHKTPLKTMLQLRTRDSYHLDVRGLSRTTLYYDYFSNLHFGYVGRAAGYSEYVLLNADKWLPDFIAGNPDPNDDVAIRAGIALHDSGQPLTKDAMQHSVEASIAKLRQLNAWQVRSLAW